MDVAAGEWSAPTATGILRENQPPSRSYEPGVGDGDTASTGATGTATSDPAAARPPVASNGADPSGLPDADGRPVAAAGATLIWL